MRRVAIVGVPIGVGVLMVQVHGATVHEHLVAHCEAMFERMPHSFPPKKMMRGVEEIRVKTTRILELLEADKAEADKRQLPAASVEAVGHAA